MALRALCRRPIRPGAALRPCSGAPPRGALLYEGLLAPTLRTLKLVSVTTCGLGVVGMPGLMLLNDTVPLSGRVAVTATAMLAAVGSTALLNACTKPYVITLRHVPDAAAAAAGDADDAAAAAGAAGDATLEATTLTLLARTRTHAFRLSEIEPLPKAMHPFVNFAARGVPLYLEKELLATLAAGALPAPEEEDEEDEEEEDEDDEQVEPRGAEAVQDGDRPGRARHAPR